MLQNLLTSLLAFISTNIDDIFILMLFFGLRSLKDSTIIVGQYLGIITLVIISVIGSYVGTFFDARYIGLLGLFPIYLAIKHVVGLIQNKNDDEPEINVKSVSFFAVAGVTIANGGDNIGVYVPLLSTMSQTEKVQMIIVFMIMTYVWCMAGKYLAAHPLVARQLEKFGHVLMPIVLLLLGAFILIDSGAAAMLMSL